jgi:hypothetical protein
MKSNSAMTWLTMTPMRLATPYGRIIYHLKFSFQTGTSLWVHSHKMVAWKCLYNFHHLLGTSVFLYDLKVPQANQCCRVIPRSGAFEMPQTQFYPLLTGTNCFFYCFRNS